MKNRYWMSIADMMSGLMVIFLFISICFINRVDGRQKRKEQLLDEALKNTFGERANQRVVNFGERPLLFAPNSSKLPTQLQQELSRFFPDYVRILTQQEFYPYVEEIGIEGFASTEWDWKAPSCRPYKNPLECSYMNNSALSQRRARAVMKYCLRLNDPLIVENYDWLLSVIQVDGLSFSQVKTLDGSEVSFLELKNLPFSESAEATRRVQFRVTVDVDGGKIARLLEAQNRKSSQTGLQVH